MIPHCGLVQSVVVILGDERITNNSLGFPVAKLLSVRFSYSYIFVNFTAKKNNNNKHCHITATQVGS